MKRGGLIAIIVIALLLLGAGGCLVGNYNRLVAADQSVKNRWAEVDNQLQRRNDLIGNLVESVKGIASQEQAVFGQIANARAALGGAHPRAGDRGRPRHGHGAVTPAGGGGELPAA